MLRHELRLNSLRAFEVAARRRSLTAAAEELHVTHSAIRHHIKILEEHLGVPLFYRAGRNVRCTEAGEVLLSMVGPALDQIASAVEGLRRHRDSPAVSVTLTPSFASKWLVPRLGRFRSRCPDVEVHLHPSLDLVDFRKEPVDVGIRTGAGAWPGLHAEELMPIHMTPMCSPDLLAGPDSLSDPENLRFQTLIHADVPDVGTVGTEWKQWLDAAGIDNVAHTQGHAFEDPGLALQAAIDGQGVAVSYLELARADVASGRLVLPFKLKVKHSWSYYLVGAKRSFSKPLIVEFQEWLKKEAGADSPTT